MTLPGGGIAAATVTVLTALTACSATTVHPHAAPPSPATTTRLIPARGARQRPNVLVITADDMRADDLRWMPQTRRLIGGTGLTFENAFASYPLCAPSRASFLTGKYAHNHHVLSNSSQDGFHGFDDSRTIATVLHGAGYRTGLVGKYLNGYGQEPTHVGHHPSLTYVPPGWSQWWGSTDHRWAPGEGPGGRTYDYTNLTSNVNGQIRSWPGRYTTTVTSEQTQGLVRQFGGQAPPRPWFIWWTPVAPHSGFPVEPDDPGRTRQSNGKVVDWVTPARPDWVKHRFDSVITHGAGTPPDHPAERNVADKPRFIRVLPPLAPREKRAERDVTRQRAEALFVLDGQIADTLRTLQDTGQARNTIVVFTSDNGFYLGEHRLRKGKHSLYEPSIRVPLLMSGPHVPHGRRYDPVTGMDLAVTIAGWAHTLLPAADGVDLRQTITQGDQGWNRPVVIEGRVGELGPRRGRRWTAVMRGLDTVGIRTGRWKFVRYSTGEWELYDLRRDPLEMHSLPASKQRAVRLELQRVWRRYATCAGAACRRSLPADLRTGPRRTRRITQHEKGAVTRYYGD